MSSLNYVATSDGLTYYTFSNIDSVEICKNIKRSCDKRSATERLKAIAYLATSIVFSLLFRFSVLNFLAAQMLTIYFFASDAWKKTEHYSSMSEQACLRVVELCEQTGQTIPIM